ncbi:hypothetical protein GUITHDRAFT_155840 [Guillardia theta CCMP2712]|uniref:RWP-RK domain-containing protein n=2 Tax=Guillardia theta TaxID=55529 RepID=L1IDB4_GUITC|nr:hypothetical protein GUITHDRAFT_155840 [Guillardia theta CCMP2712]EKX34097.1 hypothetical protein GUITHDRAFT_155840 [Guillardia theta CCMP2712]|mmetsp:Transcript_25298/g.83628  ORF Transcript_25298/g.83628 Transcript_25298/m.83628 type:complete len:175 (+) Transcript_25298:277-801(+)|eukprot:XP_005821077.1 hypothetical protein GUITHDRAFT_155840 [Guillardia theta CCMP2712]
MTETVVVIRARTRHGLLRKSRSVKLDLNMISTLYNMRQEDAATTLGISLTSLKIACRRLGLKRWPNSRVAAGSPILVEHDNTDAGAGSSTRPLAENNHGATEPLELFDDEVGDLSLLDEMDDACTGSSTESRNDTSEQPRSIDHDAVPLDENWIKWFLQCDEDGPVSFHSDPQL